MLVNLKMITVLMRSQREVGLMAQRPALGGGGRAQLHLGGQGGRSGGRQPGEVPPVYTSPR